MLASIFSLNVIQTALELGCIYALVALALFLSYSILNIADLSTDGCFTLGCAVACQVALTGHPFLALVAAMAAGVCSGFVTAFLQTRLGVESIMAGIIVNTGLYTINLAVMGFSSTLSLVKTDTVFSLAKTALAFTGGWYKLVLTAAVIALACVGMVAFLGTRLGLSIRATGDNAAMVAVFLAFATGTSWGTFSILIPIVCHAFPQGEMLVVSIAACLSGAVCGDHCSPISDTTIMASAGAHCSHVNHVSTQLPYAITAASCSAACYVITGLTQMFLGSSASLWTSLILLGVAIVLELVVLNILRVKLGKKTKA